MTSPSIDNLTIEQKARIPEYREKWRAIATATEPIDRQKATAAINAIYAAIGKPSPDIVFFDSPYAALKQPKNILSALLGSRVRGQIERQLGFQQGSQLREFLEGQLQSEAMSPLKTLLWSQLANQLALQFGKPLWNQLRSQGGFQNDNCIQPELWASYAALVDFCLCVLGCEYDLTKWEALQSAIKDCGWFFTWEKICFACDRPVKLSYDRQRLVHAEAEPAILFADGFGVYAHRGTVLPEKYGKLPPNQWQAKWILEAEDPDVRRALYEGIGKLRVRRELGDIDLSFLPPPPPREFYED